MARIIIASASNGRQLEVEQAQFDDGFFPGYVYVSDAPAAATTEPTAEETRVAGFVSAGGSGPLPVALRAALVSKGTTSPAASLPAGTEYVWMKTDGAGTLLDIVSGVA